MCIRVSEEEVDKFKRAARKEGEEKMIRYTDFKYHVYGKNGGGEGKWTHSLANFKKK